MSQIQELFDNVVNGGYCIGCGACAALDGSPVRVQLDKNGCMKAVVDPGQMDNPAAVLEACPFAAQNLNEDVLGAELFGRDCRCHGKIGRYLNTYAGHVLEEGFREHGSSGGFGSWVLVELLKRKMVDAVIHVHERDTASNDGRLFAFGISHSEQEIRKGAKSRYYPVEMSEVLRMVKERPMRYAIVGVPCFIKAVRLLQKKDPVVAERILYCIGLVCGHLKSTAFAQMFAWQCGILPHELGSIDFRKKISGQGADLYGVEATGTKDGKTVRVTKTNREFFGQSWGHGFFKYQACDYCDDVLAETADISVGDAWLPQYVKDDQGTNVVVVRHPAIADLIVKAQTEGRVHLEDLPPDEIARSQDAGLRHRREGLAYRLYSKDQKKLWRPIKRVQADCRHLDSKARRIQDLRMAMASLSHEAFSKAREAGNFELFRTMMGPLLEEYRRCYRTPMVVRVKRAIKKFLGWSR